MFDFEMIGQATRFATKAHEGQMRKYVNRPYIEHPIGVSMMVAAVPGASTEMIVAALLHDVVEDTPFTLQAIERNFGEDVAYMVEKLTDISTPADGNRAARKRIDAEHTASGDWRVHTIKTADMIHNTQSIGEFDPKFYWGTYRNEKIHLLQLLNKAHPMLMSRALEQIVYIEPPEKYRN